MPITREKVTALLSPPSNATAPALAAQVFSLSSLRRLDLGHNSIERLPATIGDLTKYASIPHPKAQSQTPTFFPIARSHRASPFPFLSNPRSLEELWLNDNPLLSVPVELERCRRLRVLDLRNTRLEALPREASRLPQLVVLDLRGTDLRADIQEKYATGGPAALVAFLGEEDERTQLRDNLLHRLSFDVFKEAADTEAGAISIEILTDAVVAEFSNLTQLRTVIRNAERLFAGSIDKVTADRVRERYEDLAKSNRRKQLSAEIELKLRALYFDVIRPEAVEGIVHDLMHFLPTLEDIQFLLAHAPALFPEKPDDIDGALVFAKLQALRRKLQEERASAMNALERALEAKYPDREPVEIKTLAKSVGKQIRSTVQLRSFAADVGVLFPAEFTSIDPDDVVRAFEALQRSKGVVA